MEIKVRAETHREMNGEIKQRQRYKERESER